MDFGNPWSLFSGVVLGIIGTALFIYGKKQERISPIIAGVVLCAVPYFVASVLITWLLAAACVGGLYLHSRQA